MPPLALTVERQQLRLVEPFRISGCIFEDAEVVVARLSDGVHEGRGEGSGVYYLADDADNMIAEIETARSAIEQGITRNELREQMPPGGGRNAIDCALWELEARQAGKPAWQLAGIKRPQPLLTTMTIGADDPAIMARKACGYSSARAIKIKLTGELELDGARVQAVRAARPEVWLGVDANQGYDISQLSALQATMAECSVSLIEQPLVRGREADLEGFERIIPIAADESALTIADVDGLAGRFDVFNIKLDKCGGLTEALIIAGAARAAGLSIMVGNMISSSLAMAPACIVGQHCDIVDLDGPTFLARDRSDPVVYEDGYIVAPDAVWGAPRATAGA